MDAPLPDTVSARLDVVHQAISMAANEAGRKADTIQLLAVAKTATQEGLREAFAAGQVHFAHNRVQDLAKAALILPTAQWHLIGPLQKNKVRKAISLCSCFQALGDVRISQVLQRILREENVNLKVLVQVRDPADARHGIALPDLVEFLAHLAKNSRIQVLGLMTLASPDWNDAEVRHHFARVRIVAEQATSQLLLPPQPILSMGMSADYRLAIAEGATLVRLGRVIFPPKDPS